MSNQNQTDLEARNIFLGNYELLDSGEGEKLERFGTKVLRRPSSICLWKKGSPKSWAGAHANFIPKSGWKFNGPEFETWVQAFGPFKLELRLQTSGLVGVFTEHLSYFKKIEAKILELQAQGKKNPRVLNLFAYTGAASVWAASLGCQVTHVDLSKKALTWADNNFKLNKINPAQLRLIPEDALKYVAKELRKNSVYDIVIVDPPTFSRIEKNQSWQLEEVIAKIIADCVGLIDKNHGGVFITCHDPMLSPQILQNILRDEVKSPTADIGGYDLSIPEANSKRLLPAGHFAWAI